MPTKKSGRDHRPKTAPARSTARSARRPVRIVGGVSVGRDLHCADFVSRDKNITYNYAPANLERLIERLLEFLEGGAVFQRQGDRLAAELNGETLSFSPDAAGLLMHRRSPRAYWLGLIVDPQHSIWSTLFVPLKATADVAQVPLEIRLHYQEYIPASGPDTLPRTETLEDITAAVSKHRAFVIVGDPGAGKTITLRKLALDHARAALANDSELPAPFFVRLSQQGEQSPYEFLCAQWRQCTGGDFGDALADGGLLILADGLNELPRDPEIRRTRLKAWREFVQDDAGRNQFVFTSRERGEYAGELDLPNVWVEPLDAERIDDYVRRWKAEGLLPYLKDPKSRLGELARNPFYLNLLVHAHHEDAALLANRGRLLRQFVRRLWEREERQARKDWLTTDVQRQTLSALAYAMQVKGVNLTLAARDAAAFVPTSIDVDDDEPLAVKPMALFRLARAELLLDPALEKDVRFYHQLLQEYFAAEALLARFQAGEDESVHWRAPRREDEMPPTEGSQWDPLPEPPGTGWEESTILACGLAEEPEHLMAAVRAHNPNLAARCWLESGIVWGTIRETLIKPQLQQDLLTSLYDPTLHLRTRLQCGHTLGWLGDPRFSVQTRGNTRYVEPALVRVPTGRYRVGPEWNDPDGNDLPAETVELSAFEIGKWPVTNAEFACFVEAGGYQDARWWDTELAERWRQGEEIAGGPMAVWLQNWRYTHEVSDWRSVMERSGDFSPHELTVIDQIAAMPEERVKQYLASAVARKSREHPAFWDRRALRNPAQPVTGVTWFEAAAYCAWLSAVTGRAFRLPSNVEWEVAAGGTWAKAYPWGADWIAGRANTIEGRLQGPSPVGAFVAAGGVGPYGAEDQSGNVWEWTRSPSKRTPGARAELYGISGAHCVRGGSWDSSYKSARCAQVEHYALAYYSDSLGFRIVASAPVFGRSAPTLIAHSQHPLFPS